MTGYHRMSLEDCLHQIPNAASIARDALQGSSVPECLKQRYSIRDLMGRGSSGQTFLAIDESDSLRSACVIKQLSLKHQNTVLQPTAVEQFHQQALHLVELGSHPHIPQLLDFFEQDGLYYLVQEWVDGQNLEQELTSSPFNESEIRQLLQELLPVLQFMHDRQIIHRDIKPANIIRRRTDQHLVLVDLGTAQSLGAAQSIHPEMLIGSAEYAAPEQMQGRAIFASDLYSLGMTCLYLLTQVSPFDLHGEGEDGWQWSAALAQPISPSLQHILTKLLQSNPRQRYQTAREVLADLEVEDTPPQPSSIVELTPLSSPQLPVLVAPLNASHKPSAATIATLNTIRGHNSTPSATIYLPGEGWYSLSEPRTPKLTEETASFSSRMAATTPSIQKTLASFISRKALGTILWRQQLSGAATKDAIEMIFSGMLFFILACIGSMALVCIFFEMERQSAPTPPGAQAESLSGRIH